MLAATGRRNHSGDRWPDQAAARTISTDEGEQVDVGGHRFGQYLPHSRRLQRPHPIGTAGTQEVHRHTASVPASEAATAGALRPRR